MSTLDAPLCACAGPQLTVCDRVLPVQSNASSVAAGVAGASWRFAAIGWSEQATTAAATTVMVSSAGTRRNASPEARMGWLGTELSSGGKQSKMAPIGRG